MSSRESYYEALGLTPGASAREVKDAYRDLAKVWHPDRFAHDPRLQQKAQEKLKEINEAYKGLTSGAPSAPRRRPAPPPRPDARAQSDHSHADKRNGHQLSTPLTVLLALFVAGAALFVGLRLMRPTPAPAHADARPQAVADDRRDSTDAAADADATTAPTRAEKRQSASQRRAGAGPQPDAAPAAESAPRPLPTVQRTIDAETGLLARPDCPLKAARTYAAGEEPRAFCAAVHARR